MVAVQLRFCSASTLSFFGRCCCCEMSEDAGKMFFFVQTCPRAESCSARSWKQGRCWDWSEEEAKGRLVFHLVNSSLHQMDPEEAEEVALEGVIEQGKWPDTPVPRKKAKFDHPSAKAKLDPPSAVAVRFGSSSSSSSSSGTVTIRREQLSQAIRPINDFAHVPQSPCIF
jgi:hypothetical protein